MWDQENGERIHKFYLRNRKQLKVLMVLTYLFCNSYFEFHFWMKPEGGVRHYFLMVVFMPTLLFYTCFGKERENLLSFNSS